MRRVFLRLRLPSTARTKLLYETILASVIEVYHESRIPASVIKVYHESRIPASGKHVFNMPMVLLSRYGALPGHIESFLGGRDAGRHALMVDLISKGSHVDYYAQSHLHVFSAEQGARLTRESSRSALHEAGCEVVNKSFPRGGSVALDARLSREICGGYAITVIFMTEDLVARFMLPPMPLPNLPGLKEKVAEMQKKTENIRLNFVFNDSARSTDIQLTPP
ncbi:hypothetical protein PG991_015816 [Apiospora marii]|uniref:Uncharacterized protein n=1 Tax=Apiospora marii TaxID=335849 RepID=A0ABR1R0P4_9PEZI